MAVILRQNQNLMNQQDQDNAGQDQVVSTSTATSQTPQAAPGQGSPAGGQIQKGPSTSGRFTNIQNFIRANQSGQIGQQVGQKVGQEAEKAKGVLSQASSAFNQQAEASRQAIQQSKQQAEQAIQNIKNTQEDQQAAVEQVRQGLATQYQGPETLGQEVQIAGQAQNLQQLGQAARSEGGRIALLRRFFGADRPTYSTGQTRLDNLLLGQQSGALANIAGQARTFKSEAEKATDTAKQQAVQLKQLLSSGKADITSQAQQAIASAEAAAREQAMAEGRRAQSLTQQALQAVPGLEAKIGVGYESAPKAGELPSLLGNFSKQLAVSAKLTPEDLKALGVLGQDEFGEQLRAGSLEAASKLDPNRATTIANLANVIGASTQFKSGAERQAVTGQQVDSAKIAQLNQTFSELLNQELDTMPGGNFRTARKAITAAESGQFGDKVRQNAAMLKQQAVQRAVARLLGKTPVDLAPTPSAAPVEAVSGGGLGRVQMIPV